MIVCTTREFKQWWAPLSMLSPTSTKRTTTTNNLTKNKTGEDVISWKTCALSNCFSVVRVVRSLVFCAMFYRSLFIFCPFYYHCIVCPSIYGFWSTFWYLNTLLVINNNICLNQHTIWRCKFRSWLGTGTTM